MPAASAPKPDRVPGTVESTGFLEPLTLVGSLLPDLARDVPAFRGRRGETSPDLPVPVRRAIKQHRLVDRVTDTHPAFLRNRARLTPRYGRFAGVVADVLFDHALSKRWDATAKPSLGSNATKTRIPRFPPASRPAFIAAAHTALESEAGREVMHPGMRRVVDAMIEHRWLDRYATPAGLERTFLELSYRFTRRYGRDVDLSGIDDHLDQHAPALLADFDELWDSLIARVVADLDDA